MSRRVAGRTGKQELSKGPGCSSQRMAGGSGARREMEGQGEGQGGRCLRLVGWLVDKARLTAAYWRATTDSVRHRPDRSRQAGMERCTDCDKRHPERRCVKGWQVPSVVLGSPSGPMGRPPAWAGGGRVRWRPGLGHNGAMHRRHGTSTQPVFYVLYCRHRRRTASGSRAHPSEPW